MSDRDVEFLMVRNLWIYQNPSLRKPDFVKLHYDVVAPPTPKNVDFQRLPAVPKLTFLLLLPWAARNGNCIPNDPLQVQQHLKMQELPDLDRLIVDSFLVPYDEDASLARSRQEDAAETKRTMKDIVAEWNSMCTTHGICQGSEFPAMGTELHNLLITRARDTVFMTRFRRTLQIIPQTPFLAREMEGGRGARLRTVLRGMMVNNICDGKYAPREKLARPEPKAAAPSPAPAATEKKGPKHLFVRRKKQDGTFVEEWIPAGRKRDDDVVISDDSQQ